MKKLFGLLVIAASIVGCGTFLGVSESKVYYLGNTFQIPAKPTIIAALGNDSNHLVVRYGDQKGKNFISFSDLNEDLVDEVACPTDQFYEELFSSIYNGQCDTEHLHAFKHVFIDGRDTGVWEVGSLKIYFSIDPESSFLFTFDKAGQAIKIESDFLTKLQLKTLVKAGS